MELRGRARPPLTSERADAPGERLTTSGSVPASWARPPAAASRSLSWLGTSKLDTESTAPPATSTAWRTSDSTLLGSEPVATIAIRWPAEHVLHDRRERRRR